MRCFSSPGLLPSLALRMIGLATDRVSPFGNPGITACLQLPQAYRSLPRPSSPPCAKASTVRPYALDLSVSVIFLHTKTHTRQLSKSYRSRSSVESEGYIRGRSRMQLTAPLLGAPGKCRCSRILRNLYRVR